MKNVGLLFGALLIVSSSAIAGDNGGHDDTFQMMKKQYDKRIDEYFEKHPKKPADVLGLSTLRYEGHTCVKDDIVGGLWKRVYFVQDPEGALARYNEKWPHQYLMFENDYFYGHMMSRRNETDKDKVRKAIPVNRNKGMEEKYFIKNSGDDSEIILLQGEKAIRRLGCMIVSKPNGQVKKGDMILQGYTNAGKSYIFDIYRRWF